MDKKNKMETIPMEKLILEMSLPMMIFGSLGCSALEIKGAAIATVIGQWVSMIIDIILQK